MKTQTSKFKIWALSLLFLPLLALTIYGFSDKTVVRIENEAAINLETINLEIDEEGNLFYEKKMISLKELQRLYDNNKKPDVIIEADVKLSKATKEQMLFDIGTLGIQKFTFCDFGDCNSQEPTSNLYYENPGRASLQGIMEYNRLAKKYNKIPENVRQVPLDDLRKLETIYGFMTEEQKNKAQPFPNCPQNTQDRATETEIAEYNKLAKKYNDMDRDNMRIHKSEIDILERIFNKMSEAQKQSAEPFPDLPEPPPAPDAPLVDKDGKMSKANAEYKSWYKKQINNMSKESFEDNPLPPPPPKTPNSVNYKTSEGEEIIITESPAKFKKGDIKTGFIKIKGTLHYFVTIIDNTKYYNREGYEVNLNGAVVSKTQVSASDVVPGQYITKVYQDDKVVAEFKRDRPELIQEQSISPPPPPPTPEDPLDHIISMAKKNATFYLEGKKVSSDAAIKSFRKNRDLNIQTIGKDSKNPQVYITVEPIQLKPKQQDKPIFVNGKAPNEKMVPLTIEELTNLKLEIEGTEVTSFILKIPGAKSLFMETNSLNKEAKSQLEKVLIGDNLQLFDIKTADNKKNAPIMIQVVE